jgi:hypothetical protein
MIVVPNQTNDLMSACAAGGRRQPTVLITDRTAPEANKDEADDNFLLALSVAFTSDSGDHFFQ